MAHEEEDIVGQDIHHEHISHDAIEKAHSGLNTKVIWRVFWILLGVTIFEVSISFTSIPHTILIWTFVFLTLVKAYFIVGFFMHLRFEKIPMIYSLVLPFLLIIYLIFIALYEGTKLGLIPY
jgi:cytochrome c oxidase subunit IV